MDINTCQLHKKADITALAERIRERTRGASDVASDVRAIVDDVISRGDNALVELTERLDGARLDAGSLEVEPGEAEAALADLDADTRNAMEKACARIREFARRSLASDWSFEQAPGLTVGQVRRPFDSVGIYIPGGRYPYPSTVLMTAVPARVAGVGDIVICAPPAPDGSLNAATLAAAALVGGCRIFKVGGAQAVAAMAYGTDTVPRCMMIAGPGNAYVAAAKRLVSDVVKVDLEAGPSEVVIYSDGPSTAVVAASDLLAQLEHDPLALAVLVSESKDAIDAVAAELESVSDGIEGQADLVVCKDRDTCLALVNELAPEHLELMVEGAARLLPSITSAGCVFLGISSAVAFGDYVAGPSHVLPTGGAASRFSGLRAEDFTRLMNVVSYDDEAFSSDAADTVRLATLEGLVRHARSIESREDSEAPQAEV